MWLLLHNLSQADIGMHWGCVPLLCAALAVGTCKRAAGGGLTHGPLWKCKNCLPAVPDPGPCTPPTDSSVAVGLRGFRRYFANDSLIGRPVPCTREDKVCFRHNLVFDPHQKRCEPLGAGHHRNCDLTPNRTEFEHGSGRIIGVCREYQDPCPGYRMAYDGRCYRKEVVRDVFCGCEAKPTRHVLSGVECRSQPQEPLRVLQPHSGCRIPDLRFPDSVRERFWRNPSENLQGFTTTQTTIYDGRGVNLMCGSEQAKCFSKNLLRVPGFRGCFRLFERGPCPRNHIVAVDIRAVALGRAEGTCVHVRGGCPKGYRRMLFDNRCHEDREIKIEAPGGITRNQFGEFILLPYRFKIWYDLEVQPNGTCSIRFPSVGGVYIMGLPQPPCGAKDNSRCDLFEVEAEPPNPLVD